jgi:hypothetical protein
MMGDAMDIELKIKTIGGYQEDARAQWEHQTTR